MNTAYVLDHDTKQMVAEPPRKDQPAAILPQHLTKPIDPAQYRGVAPHGPRTREQLVENTRRLLKVAIDQAIAAGVEIEAGQWYGSTTKRTEEGARVSGRCMCPMAALRSFVQPVSGEAYEVGWSSRYYKDAADYLGVDELWVKTFTTAFDGEIEDSTLHPEAVALGKEFREKYLGK